MRDGDVLDFEIMARRLEWSYGVGLFMRQQTVGVGQAVAQPLVFSKHTAGQKAEPFVVLGEDHAQKLMDELWQAGLRPSEGSGSAGSLAATQRHLEDMRSLVFKKEPA